MVEGPQGWMIHWKDSQDSGKKKTKNNFYTQNNSLFIFKDTD